MKKVLIISTGGTMGMEISTDGVLDPDQFIGEILRYAPGIGELAELDFRNPLTADSSDMGIPEWVCLGELLDAELDAYDGFVIIHGTDTMSYTASALSYMLINLPKPVILTGSQRPLAALRTDARGNLVGAIELATKAIPEVCIYFDHKLFRGNRTKKVSIDEYDAFASPNFPCLATVGLNIERGVTSRQPTGLARLESSFDPRVLTMHVFPSMNPALWSGLLQTDVQILLVEAFGAGNIPIKERALLSMIESFANAGRLVVVCSQSMEGTCALDLYTGGRAIAEAGGASAGDMTFEATIVKSMFLLGSFQGNLQRVRQYLPLSIAGEISDAKSALLV